MQIPIKIIIFISLTTTFFLTSCKTDQKQNNFAITDTNSVTKIIIRTDTDSSVFEKKNDIWIINGKYNALPEASKYIFRIAQNIDIKAPVATEKYDSIKKIIDQRGKTIIYFDKKNREINRWNIGSYSKDKEATYISHNNTKKYFLVNVPGIISDLDKNLPAEEYYWITAHIFKYSPSEIKQIELNYTQNKQEWFKIILTDNNTVNFSDNTGIYENSEIDKSALGAYLTYFSNVKFNAFLNNFDKKQKDSLMNEKPFFTLKITDQKQKTKELKGYYKKSDKINNETDKNIYYAIIDNSEFVSVKFFETDLLLKNSQYFKKK